MRRSARWRGRIHGRPARLVALVALLAACSGDERDADYAVTSEEMSAAGEIGVGADGMGGAPPPPPPASPDASLGMVAGREISRDMAAVSQTLPSQLQTTGAEAPTTSMIIRTGESRVEVDSLEAGIAAVQGMAARLGGWVAQSALILGDRQHRSARLEVKLPAERWDELVAGLEGIGRLQQLSTSTEDVGEQFVDLTAQLGNAERLEARYLELLETRTGSLEDLLAVERELARVRERIEMMQGRLRYLTRRVAVSTMFVNLEEPVDLLAISPDSEPIRDAFRAAWRNFLGLITGGIALLGILLPLALLAAVLVWIWRVMRRRRGTGEA